MSKIIDLGVEKDHIESLTKANGINALAELLWNSLDADASEVKIEYVPTKLGNYEYIKIIDNGHGLTYEKAQDVFSRLGGSEKKLKTQSPNGRQYHGKEGKGRYKGKSKNKIFAPRMCIKIRYAQRYKFQCHSKNKGQIINIENKDLPIINIRIIGSCYSC